MGSLTPLIMSATGGMGQSAEVAPKRLASTIAAKRDAPYSKIIACLRCRVSFSLLRSALMCL